MKTIFRTLAVLAFFISFLSFSHSALAASAPVNCPAGYTCTPISGLSHSGTVLGVAVDTTPRIAYWYGKVNQHVNEFGAWVTDPDGYSGATLDKLSYCKKWYPNTVSVQDYQTETITSWKNAGNIDGPFTASVVSTQCVQQTEPVVQPSVIVTTPNGGETFTYDASLHPQWVTNAVPLTAQQQGARVSIIDLATNTEYGVGSGETGFGTVVNLTPSIAQAASIGTKNFKLKVSYDSLGISDLSDTAFTISGPVTTPACSINSFSADQSTVAPGTLVTLSWNTNCGTVAIQNMDGFPGKNFGTTSSSNTVVNQTTTYTLYGSNDSGCTGSSTSSTTGKPCTYMTKAVTVTAKAADVTIPTVTLRVNGSHDPSAVAYKSKLAVTWATKNAVSCTAYGHWVPVWNSTNQVWNNSNISTNGSMDLMAALAYNGDVSQLQFNSSLEIGIQCYGSGANSSVTDMVTVPVYQSAAPVVNTDKTPRIAYWSGKVNQHMSDGGAWISDPDGTSGASIDKLTYCKKWYPNTTSVENYQMETITTWKRAAGYEQSDYSNTVQTYRCVQGTVSTNRSFTISTPKTGDIYQSGKQLTLNWTTTGYGSKSVIGFDLAQTDATGNHNTFLMSVTGLKNDGTETLTIPSNVPAASNYLIVGTVYDPDSTLWQLSNSGIFSIKTSDTTESCSTSTPSVTVLSPNGGESYAANQQMTVSWKSCGMSAADWVSIHVLQYDANGNLVNTASPVVVSTGTPMAQNTGSAVLTAPNTWGGIQIVSGKLYKLYIQKMLPGGNPPYSGNSDLSVQDRSDNLFTITTSNPITQLDPTPRIAYWWGKVNQHTDANGNWASDPDGTSGADLDKLAYCKKWYPNTKSVETYKTETIGTFKRAAGYEQGDYSATVQTYQCVSGTAATPYVQVLSPNGGESYKVGDQVQFKWTAAGQPAPGHFQIALENTGSYNTYLPTIFPLTQTSYTWTIPADFVPGQYKARIFCGKENSDAYCTGVPTQSEDRSDNFFTILPTDTGSCAGLSGPWLKVISPNGGESFHSGDQVKIEWDTSCNISTTNMKVRALLGYVNGSQQVSTVVTGIGNGWTDNDGQEVITIPALGDWGNLGVVTQPGNYYDLYMETYFEPPTVPTISARDWSDNTFTITNGERIAAQIPSTASISAIPSKNSYSFNRTLLRGISGDDVKALQQRLQQEGVYTGPITGYFGTLTAGAVSKFQVQNNLPPVGILGPKTRSLLNQ